jgi:hypothetical protein
MSEPAADRRDFFVSFNKADGAWATWISWVLEEAGYSVWFQDWDFRGNFVEHMSRAHAQADRTLAILSDHYFGSDFTLAEWSARLAEDPAARADRLVPVKVGKLTTKNILTPIIYADLTTCQENDARQRLLERVKKAVDPRYRSKPRERPGYPSGPPREVPQRPEFPPVQSDQRRLSGDPKRSLNIRDTLIISISIIVAIFAGQSFFGRSIEQLSSGTSLGVISGLLMGGLVGLIGVALLSRLVPLLVHAPNSTAATIQCWRFSWQPYLFRQAFNEVSTRALSPQDPNLFSNWYKLSFVIALFAVIVYPASQWILIIGRTIAGMPLATFRSSPTTP